MTWQWTGPEKLTWIQAVQVDAAGMPGPVKTLAKISNGGAGCRCPQVAVDPGGRATVVWRAFDGANDRVQAAQLSVGGAVGPVHTLSPAKHDAEGPQLAVDQQGRVVVTWKLDSEDVEIGRLAANGEPGVPESVAEAVSGLERPALAVDSAGRATIAWSGNSGIETVQVNAGGESGPRRGIPATGSADGALRLVVDSGGRATVAWWRGGGANEVRSVRLDPEGMPGTVHSLTQPGEAAFEPRLAVDDQDRVTVVWEDFAARVHSVLLDGAGAAGVVQTLSAPGHRAGEPQVAAGPGGAVVVWSHPGVVFAAEAGCSTGGFDPQSDLVEAAFLEPSGEPRKVKAVSALGEQAQHPQIGVDPLGQPTVVWESYDGAYPCSSAERLQLSRGLTPPLGPPPGPAPASPAGIAASKSILRLGKKATVRNGRLRLGASCSVGAGNCTGRLKVEARVSRIPRDLRQRIRGLRKRGPKVTIALGGFQVPTGRRRTLALPLSELGKQLAGTRSAGLLRATSSGPALKRNVVWVRLRPRG